MCLLEARVKWLIIGVFSIFVLLSCPVYAATQGAGTLPLISDVSATNITQTSATISWQTSVNATSQVFYDTAWHANTANYTANVTDNTTVAVHSIPLTGLTSSTTYHYRVKSTTSGDEAVSDDYTFTTSTPAFGGFGGGGGAAGGSSTGITNVSAYVTSGGLFMETVTAKSADGKAVLTINRGTIGKTEAGRALFRISIIEMEEPPTPPTGSNVIGLIYDIGPDGATFDPAITLTITYDPSAIPVKAKEKELVIAIWDKDAEKWIILEGGTVDLVNHTVSAPIKHFTAFSVLAYVRPAPAAFSPSDLKISPTEANVGETVTIDVRVSNFGELSGGYTVTLRIDNLVEDTKYETLSGGTSRTVTFTTTKDVAGSYKVDINGISGTFIIKELSVPPAPATFTTGALSISPTEVDAGATVTISVLVTNSGDLTSSYEVALKVDDVVVATKSVTLAGGTSRTATFAIAKDVAGSHTVNINGLSGTFMVKALSTPPKPTNWWLIGGIIAGCIIVTMVTTQVIHYRRV